MKKDVIYVDTEDDITSIIEKVKNSQEKIVALVPPKRVGVLQSAVNLKLLQKAAGHADKRVVLITGNKSLGILAAGVQMPVAKTLQSRPELLTADDAPTIDEEEIINGDELPVGELHEAASRKPEDSPSSIEEIELPADLESDEPKNTPPKKAKNLKKTGPSIPNFDSFRKKLIIGGVAGFALIIFLIWATFFAPQATVNISAKTDPVDLKLPLTLKTDATTAIDQGVIQPIVQQTKKTATAQVTATGKKDVGEKATGTMELTRTSTTLATLTIPAGTGFSSGNFTFVSTESATLGKIGSCDNGVSVVQCSATVKVQAAAVGEEYNLSARDYQPTVSGIEATGSTMSGGSKRQVTVISQGDVDAAQQKLTAQNQDAIKKQLSGQFTGSQTAIPATFTVTAGQPNVSPAVGAEASQAQLSLETTYTMFGVTNKNIDAYLDSYLKKKITNKSTQQVFDNGRKDLQYTKFDAASGTLQLGGTGYIGPKIDQDALKPKLVGKNYEEIRQIVKQVEGVTEVDTRFSPFWVSSVGSEERITIKFKVSKDESN